MANISHELRTPLTLMLGPLGSIFHNKYGDLPEKVRDILSTIHKNGLKLLKLINNLLDLSKIESGKMRLKFKSVEIVSFCKYILDTVIPLAEERELALEFKHVPQSAEIMIDTDQFDKVILNLLSNAIKFTPEGGSVALSVDEDERQVIITVEDTGVGIPEDMKEKIFDRFSQVDGSSSRKYEGTGIGLSLVKDIVDMHKGAIQIISDLGRGSRFIVRMPKGSEHITDEMHDRRKADIPVAYKKRETDHEAIKMHDLIRDHRLLQLIDLDKGKLPELASPSLGAFDYTLLAIDDNIDMLKMMKLILSNEYGLLFATSAEDGIKIMTEKKPDLVICDVMMPGMDGYAFCGFVKSNEQLKHIPVLLVTALADVNRMVEGVESGADDYLPKPFDSMELKARIRSLLRMRKIEAELAMSNQNFKVRTDDLIERQEILFHSLIKSLIYALDAKDEYTRNHSIRVTEYSLAIADMMGLTDREKKKLELAAILHDVGKIAVPESILLKADALTAEEFAFIKTHPARGEDIVKHIVELKEIAAIVRAHHEKYDGSGYPDGLLKQDIPIGARIMSVADTYDAMTSNRPYRIPLSHNFAVKEIVNNSGKQFDPEVVDHFLRLADQFKRIKANENDKTFNGFDDKHHWNLE